MDEFKNYTVTCRVAGCGNTGASITLLAPIINPQFICGVCGQQITDIVSA